MKAQQLLVILPFITLAVASPLIGVAFEQAAQQAAGPLKEAADKATSGATDKLIAIGSQAADAADAEGEKSAGNARGSEGVLTIIEGIIDLNECKVEDLQDVVGCVGTCVLSATNDHLAKVVRGIAPGLGCTLNQVGQVVAGAPSPSLDGICDVSGECVQPVV